MSRIVRTGDKDNLYRITSRDLPADHDLRYSCWTWVDASRLDLSTYDCRYMDIHDSECQRVILPEAIKGLVSLRSAWTDATIPSSADFCGWSLISEVLRRHTAPPSSREAGMIEWVAALIQTADTDWRDPWMVSNTHFKVDLGLTQKQIYDTFAKYAFGGYPNLLCALEFYSSQPKDALNTRPTTLKLERYDGTEREIPLSALRPLGTEDRWAAARMGELYVAEAKDAWELEVIFLAPTPYVIATNTRTLPSPDWREKVRPF